MKFLNDDQARELASSGSTRIETEKLYRERALELETLDAQRNEEAGEDAGEGRLTRTVRPHDGVYFAFADGKANALEDLFVLHTDL